jgi:hypothetical protein
VAYLQERLRLGSLDEDRLRLAVHAGSRAAPLVWRRQPAPLEREIDWLDQVQLRFTADGEHACASSARRRARRLRRRLESRSDRREWVVRFDDWGEAVVWRVVLAILDFARAHHAQTHPHLRWRRVDRLIRALRAWVECPCDPHAATVRNQRIRHAAPDWLPLSEAAYLAHLHFHRRAVWGQGYPLFVIARAGRRVAGDDALREAIRATGRPRWRPRS